MFIEERHQAILDIITQKGSITTGDIQENFGVSYDSAKRDLRILEEKGLLKRTHGGAIEVKKIGYGGECHDLSARERVQTVKENYLAIAQKAVEMIESKDVIYLTNASIGYLIARNIPFDLCCTIVTSSISIAEELRKYENITVIVTGGEMARNGSFYNGFTIDVVKRLRFDKSFLTSACISSKFGLSIQKSRNIDLINAVIDSSKVVVGLFPTEKIGFDSIISICPANKLDYLVTDWAASEEDLKAFDEQGIEVIIVDKED
jgi:DeoR/GlpR family transcriptional regulator of sugar metabolism